VPYSEAQLEQVQDAIAALIPQEPTPLAWFVSVQPDPEPIVDLMLYDNRSAVDVSAAQQIVSQYDGMVELTLSGSGAIITSADPGLIATTGGRPTTGPVTPSTSATPSTQTPSPAPSTSLPPAAPSLGKLAYHRHEHLALVTVAPGSGALYDVVVSAVSRSGRLLARKTLNHLSTTSTVTLHLTSAPRRLSLEVHAHTAAGTSLTFQRKL